MKRVESAGIVVYFQENNTQEFLVLQYAAGHWDFAKGHMETGETKEQTAKRELKEETGLTAEIVPGFFESFKYIFSDYTDGKPAEKTVYFFVGQTTTKNVTLSHEHLDYKWLPYKQAVELLTYKNVKILLNNVNAFLNG